MTELRPGTFPNIGYQTVTTDKLIKRIYQLAYEFRDGIERGDMSS